MREPLFMSDRFSQLLPILGAIVAFLFAALLLVYIFRLVFGRRIRAPGARNRPRRLDVVDVFDLDKERQLVIVRRDNTEHLLMIGGPNDVLVEASINRVEGVLARTAGAATGWPSAPGVTDGDTAEPPVPRSSAQGALNLPPELFEPEPAPEPASTRPAAPPRIEPTPSEPVRPAPPPPPPRPPAAPPSSTAASAPPSLLPATGAASAAAAPLRAPPSPPAPAQRPPAPPPPARPAPPPFLSRAQQRPGPARPETDPSAGPASGPVPEAPPAPRPAPPPLRPPPSGQPRPQGGFQPPFPPRPSAPRPAPPPQPPVAAPADTVDTLEEEMARLLGRPEQE
jgi:flagellar protein FliO/FliZ